MTLVTVYGIGGYDPDLPDNNVVDEYEVPDPPAGTVPAPDTQALAGALAALPSETLGALRQALGLT